MKNIKQVTNLITALSLLAVVIFLLFLAVGFVETTLPNNSYAFKITGLSGLTVNGTATIMVPIPASVDGVPVMSKVELTGRYQAFGWQTAIRETPYGKMLAFTTTEGYVSDIFIPFSESEKRDEPRLLMPVLATPDNVSVEEFSRGSGGTYTTAVFLDGFVPPENATPISFDLNYWGGGSRKHLVNGDLWATTVKTPVPSTESGFVPVPAGYHVTAGGIYL